MEAYSLDLRRRVAAARDAGDETVEELADRFDVSESFIRKLLARRRRTGSLRASPHRGGFASALAGEPIAVLAELVATQPDATLAELRDRLALACGVWRSVPVIGRAVAVPYPAASCRD